MVRTSAPAPWVPDGAARSGPHRAGSRRDSGRKHVTVGVFEESVGECAPPVRVSIWSRRHRTASSWATQLSVVQPLVSFMVRSAATTRNRWAKSPLYFSAYCRGRPERIQVSSMSDRVIGTFLCSVWTSWNHACPTACGTNFRRRVTSSRWQTEALEVWVLCRRRHEAGPGESSQKRPSAKGVGESGRTSP